MAKRRYQTSSCAVGVSDNPHLPPQIVRFMPRHISGPAPNEEPGKPASTISIVPEQYRGILQQLLADAHESLLEGKRLPSTYYIGSCAAEVLQAVPVDTSSQSGKEASVMHAKRMATYLDADFVVLVTEAWALPRNKADDAEAILSKWGSVGQYPGKLDVAWFQLETRHGLFTAQAKILPVPPSKKRRKLGTIEWMRADEAQGTMAGVLARLPTQDGGIPSS